MTCSVFAVQTRFIFCTVDCNLVPPTEDAFAGGAPAAFATARRDKLDKLSTNSPTTYRESVLTHGLTARLTGVTAVAQPTAAPLPPSNRGAVLQRRAHAPCRRRRRVVSYGIRNKMHLSPPRSIVRAITDSLIRPLHQLLYFPRQCSGSGSRSRSRGGGLERKLPGYSRPLSHTSQAAAAQ